MSLEANAFLLFPYSQRLAASKFSLADLHSHCAAPVVVPPSLRNAPSTPHLNGVISEDADNVDSGASRSRRYSIVSCSNDLEYISRFNQEVMKVSAFLLRTFLPVMTRTLSVPHHFYICPSSVSHVSSPLAHHTSYPCFLCCLCVCGVL